MRGRPIPSPLAGEGGARRSREGEGSTHVNRQTQRDPSTFPRAYRHAGPFLLPQGEKDPIQSPR